MADTSVDGFLSSLFVSPVLNTEAVVVSQVTTRVNEMASLLPAMYAHPLSFVTLWANANLPFKVYNNTPVFYCTELFYQTCHLTNL
jgi:hypothetical protein